MILKSDILKDKTCPNCGAKDALHICAHTFVVSCSVCLEIIRVLDKKEKAKFLDEIEELMQCITFY